MNYIQVGEIIMRVGTAQPPCTIKIS